MLSGPSSTASSLIGKPNASPVCDEAAAERLGNLGYSSVVSGHLLEGVSRFMGALYCLSYDFPQSSSLSKPTSIQRPSKKRKTCDKRLSVQSLAFPDLSGETYKTSEYDEGMNTFSACLPVSFTGNNKEQMKAILLHNLATVNVFLEQFDVAHTCFKRGLEITLGDESSPAMQAVMLLCLQGMGNLYFKCGRIEPSVDCYTAALEICEKQQQDVDKVQMAAILNSLGVLHFHLHECEVDKAVSLFHRSLSIQRKCLGPRNTTTATTLNNLGRVLCIGGLVDEALKVYQEAFETRILTLGFNSLDVAATAYNIGQTFQQRKNFEQALEYYNHFMSIATSKLGHAHMDVALTLRCIAQIHQEFNRVEKALEIYGTALEVARSSVGRHADVASILNKMGNLYFEKGDLEKAQEAYQVGLQVERENLDANHPNIGVTLSNLGLIFQRKGQMEDALKIYQEVLEIQKKCYSPNDIRVAKTWATLGHIQSHMGKFPAALDSYQQALRVRRSSSLGEDLEVASTLNSVGLVLFKMGIHGLALRTFAECLRIRRSLLGPNDRDVAVPLYNMATIHQVMGCVDEALQHFLEVLRIERFCGDEDVTSTLKTLAQLYEASGERDRALWCYQEILGYLDKESLKDEPVVVDALISLANLHLRRGESQQLVERAVEAVRVRQRHEKSYSDLRLNGFFLFHMSKICPEAAPVA